jgi:alpha-amylase/alpha-mannosidase (GH57 family)
MGVRLALLWHMHQPMYTDPATGEAILPWVRFHATHAYYDMGRVLDRHPSVKATVNFVPSLLEQLEGAASGTARERYLELTRARPQELSEHERRFVVEHFFMADHEQVIRPLPRFWELLQLKSAARGDLAAFGDQDLLDLQVLFNLGWMGFAARQDEPEVARLVAKGARFDEADKAALLDAQQRVLRAVVPLWRRLADRGQVELSTTPYYHPILPLLCDSDSARRAMPEARLPRRFSHPGDARAQVKLAIEKHFATFGRAPSGMWPAEGSVSPEAAAVLASEGVRWIATDEGNLFRSQPSPAQRGQLYQAWSYDAGGHPLAIGFRDRTLSDRIGFTYARMHPRDAVADFIGQLRRAEADARTAGLHDPLVPVVLDGENAWERYVGAGEEFLDSLHQALATTPGLVTQTMSAALAKPTARLTHLHSGSWIDSNFRVWIGHQEDNEGWNLLGEVRTLVAKHEDAGDVPAERLEQAKRLLYQAEGSDWFWWYGDDFDTENAAEFDALFRDRLVRAATLVGEAPPWKANEPIGAKARRQGAQRRVHEPPTALVRPTVDGRARSWTEWLGAGRVLPNAAMGSMHRESSVKALHYGCDLERLYLRLDPVEQRLRGVQLVVSVGAPGRQPVEVRAELRSEDASVSLAGGVVRCGEVVELSLPLAALGLAAGEQAELSIRILRDGSEEDRIPPGPPLGFEIPDADFERRHWRV